MSVARPRVRCASLLSVALFASVALVGCGGGDGDAAAQTDPQPAPATAAPATSSSAAATTTTNAPTTTIAAVTTTAATLPVETAPATTLLLESPETLPAPIDAPVDARGQEPIIELGTIEIPKIALTDTMFEGIRLTTLDRGPGHWPGTAMPGALGNVVVAGHRTSHSKPFRNLDQLVAGDEVVFTTADGTFTYTVTSTEIVTPDAVHIVDQTPEKTATLFACHPPGSTRQRIVIHLALVEV